LGLDLDLIGLHLLQILWLSRDRVFTRTWVGQVSTAWQSRPARCHRARIVGSSNANAWTLAATGQS